MLKKSRKELDDEIKKKRNDFTTDRLDMSIGEMINLYNDGELIISPEFQRLFRWSEYQKTRLIESILLGIPIPPIFVVQNNDGVWELVDGLQRLSTLFSFFGELKESNEQNNWALTKGDLVEAINGKTYEDLSTFSKISIKRYVFRVEIISSDSDYNIRYELFNRLNTGGTKLSEQEIRNVIHRGISDKFNKFLHEKGSNPEFLKVINISESKEKSLYADELVLRFCSLYKNEKITQLLVKHMNSYMKQKVDETKVDESSLHELGYIFDKTVNLLGKLNNNQIFVPLSRRGGFSPTLYDGIMIGLAYNIYLYENNIEKLNNSIEELKERYQTDEILGSRVHNPKNVMERLKIADEIFRNID